MLYLSMALDAASLGSLADDVIEMAQKNKGNESYLLKGAGDQEVEYVDFAVPFSWRSLNLSGMTLENDTGAPVVSLVEILNIASNLNSGFELIDTSNFYQKEFEIDDLFFELKLGGRAVFKFNYRMKINRLSRLRFFRGQAATSIDFSKQDYLRSIADFADR